MAWLEKRIRIAEKVKKSNEFKRFLKNNRRLLDILMEEKYAAFRKGKETRLKRQYEKYVLHVRNRYINKKIRQEASKEPFAAVVGEGHVDDLKRELEGEGYPVEVIELPDDIRYRLELEKFMRRGGWKKWLEKKKEA
jgi:pheromone shutdown protein TraB